MWFFWALLSRFISAGSNIVESHYYHKVFNNAYAQTFISSLYWVVILPVVYLFANPVFPALTILPYVIGTGLAYTICLTSFFMAYRFADTSSVVSLFTIGRVFVPIMAFFLYGEQLTLFGYVGFAVVLIGSLWLSIKPGTRQIDLRPLGLATISGFFFAVYTTGTKYVMAHSLHWFDGWFWITACAYLFGLLIFFLPFARVACAESFRRLPYYGLNYSSYALLCLLSMSAYCYALSLTKASYVVMASQLQPFFAMGMAYAFHKAGWFAAKENFEKGAVEQKLGAFLLMALGLALTLI